jgi:hypothetical protein
VPEDEVVLELMVPDDEVVEVELSILMSITMPLDELPPDEVEEVASPEDEPPEVEVVVETETSPEDEPPPPKKPPKKPPPKPRPPPKPPPPPQPPPMPPPPETGGSGGSGAGI